MVINDLPENVFSDIKPKKTLRDQKSHLLLGELFSKYCGKTKYTAFSCIHVNL